MLTLNIGKVEPEYWKYLSHFPCLLFRRDSVCCFQNRKAIYQQDGEERFKRSRPGMLVKRKRSNETNQQDESTKQSSMGLFFLILMSLQNEVKRSRKEGEKRKYCVKQKERRVIQLWKRSTREKEEEKKMWKNDKLSLSLSLCLSSRVDAKKLEEIWIWERIKIIVNTLDSLFSVTRRSYRSNVG